MQVSEEISRLHNRGIEHYARGEHASAALIWTNAQILARSQLGGSKQRYLCAENWTNGLGHIAILDFFAKRKLLGLCDYDYTVLTKPEYTANACYLDLWRPFFAFAPAPRPYPDAVLFASELPMVLEFEGRWLPFMDATFEVEQIWRAVGRAPLLNMSRDLIDRGWDKLKSLGIPRTWFVTIHCRNEGHVSGIESDFSSIRNSPLADHLLAIAAINRAGGRVIRIGKATLPRPIEGLIDLAGAADWLDVFLLSQCRFFIGCNSGPCWVAGTFGIPALLTNWAPPATPYGFAGAIILPKRLKRKGDGADVPDIWIESAAMLAQRGIEAVNSTPEEIELATQRMLLRH